MSLVMLSCDEFSADINPSHRFSSAGLRGDSYSLNALSLCPTVPRGQINGINCGVVNLVKLRQKTITLLFYYFLIDS